MREEKKPQPSPKEPIQKKPWFWPVFYVGCSLVFVGLILGVNALMGDDKASKDELVQKDPGLLVETNSRAETMKYPFKEALLDEVSVVQDFYDVAADEETRQKALLVFNQQFSTSSGVSLSIKGEPYEVLAAMSGEVVEVKLDAFEGNSILLKHANGMQTRYSSIADITVKTGDTVEQGQPLGQASENEYNQAAGVHMHFEVLENGKAVNPKKLLAF